MSDKAADCRREPYVAKFSGGRSSGMMTWQALEWMDPDAGDCVVFNNTSAEHPATYDFVAKMKDEVETFGIPFFILEFQTYEVFKRGHWGRRAGFRLATPETWLMRGEIFEEMLATETITPNVRRRFCTKKLKAQPTSEFMAHWLACDEFLPALGNKAAKADAASMYAAYLAFGGRRSEEEYAPRAQYLLGRPPSRPRQRVADFTTAEISPRRRPAQEFTALVGYRADEPRRWAKMRERNSKYARADGEYMDAPLAIKGIDKAAVLAFWRKRKFDLEIDAELGNCVHCFHKFPTLSQTLPEITGDLPAEQVGTPVDVNWWIAMEEKYATFGVENGAGKDAPLGFFLADSGMSYRKIAAREIRQPVVADPRQAELPMACGCTD